MLSKYIRRMDKISMRSKHIRRINKINTFDTEEIKTCYYSTFIGHGFYGSSPFSVFLTDTRIGANKYA